jgi:hypothetical protein
MKRYSSSWLLSQLVILDLWNQSCTNLRKSPNTELEMEKTEVTHFVVRASPACGYGPADID